jgi:putative ubiquitin-RnfH superfamily antitoxin RatB of RatAB toxin-antitoxin module
MRIQVAVAEKERQQVIELELPEGSTVADALAAARIVASSVGVWSKPCAPDTALREGDRVEVYRPLRDNPREMRRARAKLKPSTRSRNGP